MIFLCKFLVCFKLSFLTMSVEDWGECENITYKTDCRHLNNHKFELVAWNFVMLFLANLRSPEAEPEEESPKDNATNSGGNNYCNTSTNHSIFQKTLKNFKSADLPSGFWIYVCTPLEEFVAHQTWKSFQLVGLSPFLACLFVLRTLMYFVVSVIGVYMSLYSPLRTGLIQIQGCD